MAKTKDEPVPKYVSAYTYGKLKGVDAQSVYGRMKSGKIGYETFGKFKMIEWEIWKHIEFPHSDKIKENKAKV